MHKEEKDRESKGAPEKELDTFVPVPKYIKALDETQVEVPKTSWKSEIQIGKLIGQMITSVPELKEVDFRNIKIADMVSLLPKIIEVAPETITGVTSILLRKEPAWVEDNLNSDSIMELLGPFFKTFLDKAIRKVDLKMLEKLPKGPLLK